MGFIIKYFNLILANLYFNTINTFNHFFINNSIFRFSKLVIIEVISIELSSKLMIKPVSFIFIVKFPFLVALFKLLYNYPHDFLNLYEAYFFSRFNTILFWHRNKFHVKITHSVYI